MFPATKFEVAALACVTVAGLGAVPATGQVTLTEDAAGAGLVATHAPVEDNFPGLFEIMTGGMAVGDFDRDGHQDLFWVSGGGGPDKLFINNGDGTFADQAAQWGLTDWHCGNGVSVGDYNGDGFLDIYVTSFGLVSEVGGAAGRHRLYRNSGKGTFTEVAAQAGVQYTSADVADGFGSAFGDYDLDGDLDLFVTCWSDPYGNRLYRNNGDGTFTDATVYAGINSSDMEFVLSGFQPAFVDMNGDLYPELLIAGDFTTSRYFVNNGDGTFTDFTMRAGTGLDANGMGQTVADFDNDGFLDWYVTSIHLEEPWNSNVPGTGNMLYLGRGDHTFDEVSLQTGLNDGGWGWGTVAADLDHDGWQEIVEVNGWPEIPWGHDRNKLFYNLGGYFMDIAVTAGFDSTHCGRSLVCLDADDDGDLDLAVGNEGGPLQFYRNETTAAPGAGNWLRIALDTSTNPLLAPDGFGTLVVAVAGEQSWIRYLNGSPSYLATSELTVHFGLGGIAQLDELRIEWARGQVTVLTAVCANQHMIITAPVPGDLDADGTVGQPDFYELLARWGPVDTSDGLAADLNADGLVGIVDLLILLRNWGRTVSSAP